MPIKSGTMTNPILEAIDLGIDAIDVYLGETNAIDFMDHVQQLLQQHADQVIIEKAITELRKLQKKWVRYLMNWQKNTLMIWN